MREPHVWLAINWIMKGGEVRELGPNGTSATCNIFHWNGGPGQLEVDDVSRLRRNEKLTAGI